MATCKDCIYRAMCYKHEHYGKENEEPCEMFKNKADFVEVKHGVWIDKWNGKYANPTYVCSNCGEKALLESYINELDQWRHRQSLSIRCPYCGAKMDGEGRTDDE